MKFIVLDKSILIRILVKLVWLFFMPGILAGMLYLNYFNGNYQTTGYTVILLGTTFVFWSGILWIIVAIFT